MCRYQLKESRIVKNQVNMTPPKETNNASITNPKKMDFYKLSDKEFRTILLEEFSELQEHTNN